MGTKSIKTYLRETDSRFFDPHSPGDRTWDITLQEQGGPCERVTVTKIATHADLAQAIGDAVAEQGWAKDAKYLEIIPDTETTGSVRAYWDGGNDMPVATYNLDIVITRSIQQWKAKAKEDVQSADERLAAAAGIALRAIRHYKDGTDSGRCEEAVVDAVAAGTAHKTYAALVDVFQVPAKWFLTKEQIMARTIEALGKKDSYSVMLGKAPTDEELDWLVKEFRVFGFEVEKADLEHMVSAWKSDLKCGHFAKGAYLFSPCGCNPLRIEAHKLGQPWQEEYMA